MEEQIHEIRALLNELVSNSDAILSEGRILELSKQLDVLIVSYYEKSSI